MALTPEFAELFCLPGDRRNDVIAGDGTAETFDVYQYDAVTGEKQMYATYTTMKLRSLSPSRLH